MSAGERHPPQSHHILLQNFTRKNIFGLFSKLLTPSPADVTFSTDILGVIIPGEGAGTCHQFCD